MGVQAAGRVHESLRASLYEEHTPQGLEFEVSSLMRQTQKQQERHLRRNEPLPVGGQQEEGVHQYLTALKPIASGTHALFPLFCVHILKQSRPARVFSMRTEHTVLHHSVPKGPRSLQQ